MKEELSGDTGVGGAQAPLPAIEAHLQGLPSQDPSRDLTCRMLQGKKEPRKNQVQHLSFLEGLRGLSKNTQ